MVCVNGFRSACCGVIDFNKLMMKILAIKNLTLNPADGIDNFTLAVFRRLNKANIRLFTSAHKGFKEFGSLEILKGSKLFFLLKEKPDYLWGIGAPKELFYLLFKPNKTRYVINFHTILIKKDGPWKVKTPWFLRKFIFLRADLIICPSEFSAQSVKKYFPSKNVVSILNGVDLDLFSPSKKNKEYLAGKYQLNFFKPLVVFVGSLQPRKRPDLFIEIAKNYQKANFVMVGKQIPPHDFLGPVKDLKNFKWIEKMPREDIAILFASSKIFVFPSLNEPSAAVILEAMASGCVPIISKSGGNPEFLKDNESGFLIDVNLEEKENFIKKINLLITDTNLLERISKNARVEAENNSWDKTAQEYQNVLIQNK